MSTRSCLPSIFVLFIGLAVTSWIICLHEPILDHSLLACFDTPNHLPLIPPPPLSLPSPPENIGGTNYNDSIEIPVRITISTSTTTIVVNDFSFTLSSSWHAEEYFLYGSDYHLILNQEDSTTTGFTIDCPRSAGKGAEDASVIYSKQRTFMKNGKEYYISLKKMIAPENEPWFWIFIEHSVPEQGMDCLVEGSVTPEITKAMQDLYDSWE